MTKSEKSRSHEAPAAASGGGPALRRVVGIPGAVLLGLGSILGTGVFVSIGVAAEVAGPSVVVAVVLAAVVATLNGLSSAQLAASHPVSGGTYEYGYHYVGPTAGFLAGWAFLCAKSASAATAALGLTGYLATAAGLPSSPWLHSSFAVGAVILVTGLVAGGIERSSRANTAIVALTIGSLGAFVLAGLPSAVAGAPEHFRPLLAEHGLPGLLHGTALLFVAYTGYGRIATLGEEVHDPARSIPRAIGITLGTTLVLYLAVAGVAIGAVGPDSLAEATRTAIAPLAVVARTFAFPGLPMIVTLGAVLAMIGVLLNLVLGLSRVWLAMARRGDAPRRLARIDPRGSPRRAVRWTGGIVALLAATGSVHTTWSFSALTVLVYYALTHVAALRLEGTAQRYPRWVPICGLVACSGLTVWIEARIWIMAGALTAVGLGWHAWRRRG